MDTIHTLNTSLPTSTSRSQNPQRSNHQRLQPPHNGVSGTQNPSSSRPKTPPPNLHAAFKAAAFSVAQLYKTAATDSDASRAEGYQDAIDELLAFLDHENLGLGDGEGWRVRQWATERLEPSMYAMANSDADDDYIKEDQNQRSDAGGAKTTTEDAGRSTAATDAQTTNQHESRQPSLLETAMHNTTTSPTTTDTGPTATPSHERPDIFHFTSNLHAQSQDTDMTHDDNPNKSPTSLRVNLRPHRLNNGGLRSSHTSSMSLGSLPLGIGIGTKRKSPPGVADFFDWGVFGNGSSGSGGYGGGGSGKRGRME